MFSMAYAYSEDSSLSAHLHSLIRGLVFGDPCLYILRAPSYLTDAQADLSLSLFSVTTNQNGSERSRLL